MILGDNVNALTEVEKAYLAGLIDGEGCITILKNKSQRECTTPMYALLVIVMMTEEEVIRHCHEMAGIGSVTIGHSNQKVDPKYRMRYQWQMSRNQAVELLTVIKDYLIVKKDQAELALEFAKLPATRVSARGPITPYIQGKREEYFVRMKNLKRTPQRQYEVPVVASKKDEQMTLF